MELNAEGLVMVRDGSSWSQVSPVILLGLHTAAHGEFTASLADLVYREKLRLPGELALDKTDGSRENELLRLLRDAVDVFVGRTWTLFHVLR